MLEVLKYEKKLILDYLAEEEKCNELIEKMKKCAPRRMKDAAESKVSVGKADSIIRINHGRHLHETIWNHLGRSVVKAPATVPSPNPDNERLSIAYADRSKLMLHIKKYKECLKDIEQALAITKLNSVKVDLYCRKIECYLALGQSTDLVNLYHVANQIYHRTEDTPENMTKLESILQHTKSMIATAKRDHSVYPQTREKLCSTNSAVKINFNPRYGRHLIATRDIDAGEIVCVEAFYAVTRNPNEPYSFCSHCLNAAWSGLPCQKCDLNVFCSDTCKQTAWERYHEDECGALAFILQNCEHDYSVRLGFKMLMMGLKEAGSIEQLREDLTEIDDCQYECLRGTTDGKFRSNTIKSVFSLFSHRRFDRLNYLINASFITMIAIAKETKILGDEFIWTDSKDFAQNKDAVFLGSLMLKLSAIAFFNAIDFMESDSEVLVNDGQAHIRKEVHVSRGMALAPLASLINHSCSPNVGRLCTDDGRVVYYSILPIKKNSQLFDCYTDPFHSTRTREYRQKFLSEWYSFDCQCEACEGNWTAAMVDPDERRDNLKLTLPDDVPQDLICKAVFKRYLPYVNMIKSSDSFKRTNAPKLIGRDVENLMKVADYPSLAITSFIYLLRHAFEKAYSGIVMDVTLPCRFIEKPQP